MEVFRTHHFRTPDDSETVRGTQGRTCQFAMTYDAIALRMGVSRRRIQEIEKRALQKIRKEWERLGYGES